METSIQIPVPTMELWSVRQNIGQAPRKGTWVMARILFFGDIFLSLRSILRDEASRGWVWGVFSAMEDLKGLIQICRPNISWRVNEQHLDKLCGVRGWPGVHQCCNVDIYGESMSSAPSATIFSNHCFWKFGVVYHQITDLRKFLRYLRDGSVSDAFVTAFFGIVIVEEAEQQQKAPNQSEIRRLFLWENKP
jgi:hypothetical protein